LTASFVVGTVSAAGRTFPALLLGGDRVADVSATYSSAAAIFREWDFDRLTALAASAEPGHTLGDVRVHVPFEPRQIMQAGANYRTHVIDLAVDRQIGLEPGMTIEELREKTAAMMDERIRDGEPYVFLGAHSALCGPYDDVVLPPQGDHDWELELAAVIGRDARRIGRENALDVVAGWTIANDLTTRDLVNRQDMKQIGTDWLRAKNSPTFLPLGPWVVPSAFVPDPLDLRITLKLNGDTMQDESTSDMIFDPARLISYLSHTVGLRAGDLLLTGSPAGNGTHFGRYLRDGDVLEGSVTGLGEQRNHCVLEGAA
jgi:2,4-didehydro-3-deoxy-L-rhamnonate hydrolase